MLQPILVMSFYPLSSSFAAAIGESFGGEVAFYNAAKLRTMSPIAVVRELAGLKAAVLVIAIEDESQRRLAVPLSLVAAMTRARNIFICWPDKSSEPVRRSRAPILALTAARDTLRGRLALRRSRRRAKLLASPARDGRVAAPGKPVLYLDMNISIGSLVGGSIGHTAGVIGGFIDHGFDVTYASAKPMPIARAGAARLELKVPTLLATPSELNYYPFADAAEAQLESRPADSKPAFIYQRFSMHNFSGVALARRLGVPVVIEYNGSEAWAHANWGARLTLHDDAMLAERASLAGADLVVTVSDALGRELRQAGVSDDRILVYPNCVDADVFDPGRFSVDDRNQLRRDHGVPEDAFVVTFIGTFGQWHGADFLAECIRDLARHSADWLARHRIHFMLVGDGLKMPLVRDILDRDEFRSLATLTGLVPQRDAPRYLAAADLFVSPHMPNPDGSEFFGSPTKLFEYMAMERPLLAASLDQIEAVVTGAGATTLGELPSGEGRACGLLFQPGDHASFHAGLRRLVEDRTLAGELARSARREVLARYTWNAHVAAILTRMRTLGLISRADEATGKIERRSSP